MPPETEWSMWRQLRGAFNVDRMIMTPVVPDFVRGRVSQYETFEEALSISEGNRVFLEPKGEKTLRELPSRSEDVVFILGNTNHHNLAFAGEGETYRINTNSRAHMYGMNAAAIALAFWYGQ